MTLQQLKYALEIARCGSINIAAKKLFITQPSLSNAIKELESEININIFERTNRGVTVTVDGAQFLGYAKQVIEQTELLEKRYIDAKPSTPVSYTHLDVYKRQPFIEDIQDIVEIVLIKSGYARTAKAYILYRQKRKSAREIDALIGATIGMFSNYLDDKDWQVSENANTQKSINAMNNYVREIFTKKYWLYEIYPEEVRKAHEDGDCHIHDLGFFGPYCAGWDLKQLLIDGFGGVKGKIESAPAKHLRSFLGQIVNSTFTTQGETAGAQAWSSIDTYCAPFIRYDGLDFKQVKQCLQEFIFNINVPTRVGFQCPFSNLTFDIQVPRTLKDESVICGGKPVNDRYGDFQKEMDLSLIHISSFKSVYSTKPKYWRCFGKNSL